MLSLHKQNTIIYYVSIFTNNNKTMNGITKLLLILIGLNSLNVFGACPFSKYTDVVTACTVDNDFGITYSVGPSNG